MRRVLLMGVVVLVLVSLGIGLGVYANSSRAHVLHASEYNALGCAQIVGWDWLRATDARVTWTFKAADLAGADLNNVHLNFSGLVTNGVDGGAGYDAKLKFYVYVPNTDLGGGSTVRTVNPFRPQHSANSSGVGYQVYGHGSPLYSGLIRAALHRGELKVTLVWGRDNVAPINRHIAVKKSSVFLGYVK